MEKKLIQKRLALRVVKEELEAKKREMHAQSGLEPAAILMRAWDERHAILGRCDLIEESIRDMEKAAQRLNKGAMV